MHTIPPPTRRDLNAERRRLTADRRWLARHARAYLRRPTERTEYLLCLCASTVEMRASNVREWSARLDSK